MAHRFLRFLVVGGLNTAFGYGVYALFIYLGTGYIIASTLSFALGIFASYRSHAKFVFGSRGGMNQSFVLYLASWLLLYVANITALGVLIRNDVDSYLAGAVLVPPMAVLSFVVLRFIVFRHGAAGPR